MLFRPTGGRVDYPPLHCFLISQMSFTFLTSFISSLPLYLCLSLSYNPSDNVIFQTEVLTSETDPCLFIYRQSWKQHDTLITGQCRLSESLNSEQQHMDKNDHDEWPQIQLVECMSSAVVWFSADVSWMSMTHWGFKCSLDSARTEPKCFKLGVDAV